MKKPSVVLALMMSALAAPAADLTKPRADASLVFDEVDGIVAVEAEHYYQQTLTDKRAWHITSSKAAPGVTPDADPPHLAGASGGAYLEILPDTRATHGDKLIEGENFTDKPGLMAVLHYRVNVNTPGRHYVWVRSFSTGSEDNGVHVGLNGQWPESGQRWQTVQKQQWAWDCKQRTADVHTGVPMQLFLDIEKAGEHEILFSLREDGFEMDKFVLARNREFKPEGKGPAVKVKAGGLPEAFPEVAEVAPAPKPIHADWGEPPADSFPTSRDPLQWPFTQNSIWNMPIGSEAVYVPANLPPQKQVQPEEDILILESDAPRIPVVYNGTTWRGPSRYPGTVDTNRILVRDARIPDSFVVLDKNMNYACAILMDDGVTIKQNQPFSRFPNASFATSAYVYPDDNLVTGDGIKGAHGGSGMSSIGGTIRLGELLPGAPPIRHALKVTLWAQYLYYDAETKGYRWPAWKGDSYAAAGYKGAFKPLRMGSLLALPPSVDIGSLGLSLEASAKIARALQDYGAYIVDDPVASAYGIAVERSPRGRVVDEFEKAYGQAFWSATGPWADDMRKVFTQLAVVDNNGPTRIGGGGKPRQPLAPPFRAGSTNP